MNIHHRPAGRRDLWLEGRYLSGLVEDEQPQVAEVLAGRSGDHCVAQGSEQGTGVEGAKRLFGIETKGPGSFDGGWIGYSSGVLSISVDTVCAGAEDGEHFARIARQIHGARQGKLLIAATGAGRAIERNSDFAG